MVSFLLGHRMHFHNQETELAGITDRLHWLQELMERYCPHVSELGSANDWTEEEMEAAEQATMPCAKMLGIEIGKCLHRAKQILDPENKE